VNTGTPHGRGQRMAEIMPTTEENAELLCRWLKITPQRVARIDGCSCTRTKHPFTLPKFLHSLEQSRFDGQCAFRGSRKTHFCVNWRKRATNARTVREPLREARTKECEWKGDPPLFLPGLQYYAPRLAK
jgi:hypothetical protein